MAQPPGLMDEFSEEGLWWIAGNDDHKVGGTLSFDPVNGAELKLLGMLRGLVESMNASNDPFDAPTIYGTTKKGKPITLMGTINTQRQLNMPGFGNEVWIANLLVIGIHLESETEQCIFSKSFFRFTGIEKWIGHRPFETKYDYDEKTLDLRVAKKREAVLARHADFDLIEVGSLYTDNDPDTRFTVDAFCDLGLLPSEAKPLRWHLTNAVKVVELATLCAAHPLAITRLDLKGPEVRKVGEMPIHAEVHVYARMMHSDTHPVPKNHIPVVSGPELFKLNPDALQDWFENYENLSSAIALFVTVVSEKDLYSNVRFSLAIQALEVFHRRTADESVLPAGDFEKLRSDLIAAIPEGLPTNIKDKLKRLYTYLNEPSLMQRLKSLVERLKQESLVIPAFDKPYLRRLVDTRNYYTHFSDHAGAKKLDGAGMHWATRRIILFMTILLLDQLGVSPRKLADHLTRNREFERLLSDSSDPS